MIRFSVDGTKYEFDEKKLMNHEAIAISKFAGITVMQFMTGLSEADGISFTALVWLAQRRAGEDVKYVDVEFDLMEVLESLERDDDAEAESETPELDPTSVPTKTKSVRT